MLAIRLASIAVLASLSLSACSNSSSPTTPTATPAPPPTTPTVTPTRIINITGDLAFGNVNFGDSPTRVYTISNSGNAPLTFTGLQAVGGTGTAGFAAQLTSGTIAPGTSQSGTLRFTPTVAQTYSNVLTVVSDQTSGTATINVSGVGVNNRPLFTMTGVGDTVFDMPTTVARVRVQAVPTTSCQNFIVVIGGRSSTINVILGTCSVADARSLDSTYLTGGGGTVQITKSTGVSWTFTEVR